MTVEVIGVDHIFVSVGDLGVPRSSTIASWLSWASARARAPVRVLPEAGQGRCSRARSVRARAAPSLLASGRRAAVDRVARELREAGVEATEPRYYPEYAPDYYATFFEAPDGMRIEVMNFREIRRKVRYDWEARAGL